MNKVNRPSRPQQCAIARNVGEVSDESDWNRGRRVERHAVCLKLSERITCERKGDGQNPPIILDEIR